MNKNGIDLSKIKVVIFDFDDTLAVHRNRDYQERRCESEESLIGYYLNAYLYPNSFYNDIEPCDISESIFKLVNILRKNNVKMYCVSGMRFSFHLKAKENFVHKYYGNDIEVISAGSQELKIDAIKVISKLNNCNLNEILFIDDMVDNVVRFNKMGINGLLPENVDLLVS
mgnify:CR=1 FL=1